jgi:hypothetical protein
MKTSRILAAACCALLVAALLAAGCTTNSPGGNAPATPVPTVTSGTGNCGITSCHGLDLACGAGAPDFCTMEYRLGDKCRQFAHCENSAGTCRLVTSPAFDTCRACAEACEKQSASDPAGAFACEAKC